MRVCIMCIYMYGSDLVFLHDFWRLFCHCGGPCQDGSKQAEFRNFRATLKAKQGNVSCNLCKDLENVK